MKNISAFRPRGEFIRIYWSWMKATAPDRDRATDADETKTTGQKAMENDLDISLGRTLPTVSRTFVRQQRHTRARPNNTQTKNQSKDKSPFSVPQSSNFSLFLHSFSRLWRARSIFPPFRINRWLLRLNVTMTSMPEKRDGDKKHFDLPANDAVFWRFTVI